MTEVSLCCQWRRSWKGHSRTGLFRMQKTVCEEALWACLFSARLLQVVLGRNRAVKGKEGSLRWNWGGFSYEDGTSVSFEGGVLGIELMLVRGGYLSWDKTWDACFHIFPYLKVEIFWAFSIGLNKCQIFPHWKVPEREHGLYFWVFQGVGPCQWHYSCPSPPPKGIQLYSALITGLCLKRSH